MATRRSRHSNKCHLPLNYLPSCEGLTRAAEIRDMYLALDELEAFFDDIATNARMDNATVEAFPRHQPESPPPPPPQPTTVMNRSLSEEANRFLSDDPGMFAAANDAYDDADDDDGTANTMGMSTTKSDLIDLVLDGMLAHLHSAVTPHGPASAWMVPEP